MLHEISDILREVGALLLDIYTKGGREGYWEGTQFHARADKLAHDVISSRLSVMVEKYPVISEESNLNKPASNSKFWLIDPIDGTASYANGYAGYVTQIALMENYKPILAAVYAPASDEMFTAIKGKGGKINGGRK